MEPLGHVQLARGKTLYASHSSMIDLKEEGKGSFVIETGNPDSKASNLVGIVNPGMSRSQAHESLAQLCVLRRSRDFI